MTILEKALVYEAKFQEAVRQGKTAEDIVREIRPFTDSLLLENNTYQIQNAQKWIERYQRLNSNCINEISVITF